jgi:hypothetical protein
VAGTKRINFSQACAPKTGKSPEKSLCVLIFVLFLVLGGAEGIFWGASPKKFMRLGPGKVYAFGFRWGSISFLRFGPGQVYAFWGPPSVGLKYCVSL